MKTKERKGQGQTGSPAIRERHEAFNEKSDRLPWLLVAVVILGAGFVRGRLLSFPLERDEGEYAYIGQLMLHGVPPYRAAYSMKLPGTPAVYALMMMVFGQTIEGIHRGLAVINAITILLVFLLARRLFDARAGVVAAATFALLSVGRGSMGMAAHATHFISLFALAGIVALLWAYDTGRRWLFFVAGLCLGTAFLMKQHGAVFIAFGLLYVICREKQQQPRDDRTGLGRLGMLIGGCVLPFVFTCLVLAWAGVFGRFWFWTFGYAKAYLKQQPEGGAAKALYYACQLVIVPNLFLWSLAGIGLFALWFARKRAGRFFLTGLLAFSILAVCPGFYFRTHYFIVMFPAVALLVGSAVWSAFNLGRSMGIAAFVLFLLALSGSLWSQRSFLFLKSPDDLCHEIYHLQPFVESIEVGKYLARRSGPGDRLAVLGSEPQLYFYSGLRSATGYLYMYPMMENHDFSLDMQQNMIEEIETARPRFVVIAFTLGSWLSRTDSDPLRAWIERYVDERYTRVGVAELADGGRPSIYVWDDQAAHYVRRRRPGPRRDAPLWEALLVYRRRESSRL
jgi:4-amino-4-deoxy-L-arabinose transferase-like glycosyltransferase